MSQAHTVATPAEVSFTVNAVAGGTAFGQYQAASGSGVGELDLSTGQLTRITTYPAKWGGVGWMAVELPWVVWEQLDNPSELKDWSVHAWNQTTGASFLLATTRQADGSLPNGQQAIPVLRHGRAAWAQPVPSATSAIVNAELRVVELTTRKTSVAATGRLSSPIFAGRYLIWGEIARDTDYSFHAVDADTLQPAALPPQLRKPSSIGQLAGTPDYLAWSSRDNGDLTVWQIGSTHYDEFSSHDGVHFFQFMQFAGHFLVWFAGGASSVLDLTTGNGFDVPGTVSGSAESIVITEPIGQPATKGGPVASRVSRIATQSAPPITACH